MEKLLPLKYVVLFKMHCHDLQDMLSGSPRLSLANSTPPGGAWIVSGSLGVATYGYIRFL